MHTPTVTPMHSEDRKPVKVKVDGLQHIRLVSIAGRLGLTVEGLLRTMIDNGCDIAEQRNLSDITDVLFGNTENGVS